MSETKAVELREVMTTEERIAALQAKRAEREKSEKERRDAYELQVLELEEKLSENGDVRGQQFEIIDLCDLGEPPIAVRVNIPGIRAIQKAYTSSKGTDADADILATRCLVEPSAPTFREVIERRPLVMDYVLATISSLLGGAAALRQKKG